MSAIFPAVNDSAVTDGEDERPGMTVRVHRAMVLCGAMVALLPAAAAGAAEPAPVDPASLIDVPGTCPPGVVNGCNATTQVPVHCGDKDLDTLKHSAFMQNVNKETDPQSGSDVCSFDSNRIKIFQPTTTPITNEQSPVCSGANEYWIVPPNMRGNIKVDVWGGSGGDVLDTKTGRSALGGFGGFAEFDGEAHGSHGTPYALTPGDVLQITVGCKPAIPTGTPNSSGASVANGGGGATAVRWIGHFDMAGLLANPETQPAYDNDNPRVGLDPGTKLPSYADVQAQAQNDGLLDAQKHIVLAIAGGGGGAAPNGAGADGEIGGGNGSYNSVQGLGLGQGGYSANRGTRNGAGGSSANGQPSGLAMSNGGTGATPGSGGALGGVGYATGGEGGYGAQPGGGGGGGYGGGGSGSDSSGANKRLPAGGGGGGGSYSWGGDNTQSAGLRSDGMVAIQWSPSTLGGKDCVFSCRAVWPVCTSDSGKAGGATPAYGIPSDATGLNGYAIGAAGGGTVTRMGSLVRGGTGGYAGTQGTDSLKADDSFAVLVGCPGTWSKTSHLAGGGGGSTAITLVNAAEGKKPAAAGPVNSGQTKALAGGGGGAGGENDSEGPEPGGNGGVVGSGVKDSAASAAGGAGGPDGDGILSGTGGNKTGGTGYYSGGDDFGGSGAYGGGHDLDGNYGGAGGAGAAGTGTDGTGGAGQTNKTNGGFGGGSGGGGGGGYGGGGGGGQKGVSGGGGGGGSWTSNFVQMVPSSDDEGGFFGMLPGVWKGLSILLPGEFEFASRIIEAFVWGSETVRKNNGDLAEALESPKSAPFAFGYVSIQWGKAGFQAARKPVREAFRDKAPPRLRAVRMSATRFRVGARRTATAAKAGKKRIPRGTVFGLRASEPQNVRILIERRSGRRYLRVGTIRRANRSAGYDGIPFSGRLGSRKLAPGTYRASISATDHAGNRSNSARLSFTVVRG